MPELSAFLAASLTFARSLSTIELHFDDHRLLTLNRQTYDEQPLILNHLKLCLFSPKRLMRIISTTIQPVEIKASYIALMHENFQPVADPMVRTEPTAHLEVAKAKVSISVSDDFAANFQRATKKPPPSQTVISIVGSIDRGSGDSGQDQLFADLMPTTQGKVYIGFPTHQTTGFAGHFAAPALVPTVERESIDLADPFMKEWNIELLSSVGNFARFGLY